MPYDATKSISSSTFLIAILRSCFFLRFRSFLYRFDPFWFLEHPDIDPARVRFQGILSNLNTYAASDQEQPYLHAVMFLQRVFSEKYGSELTDYYPKLSSDEFYLMDGAKGFLFRAQRKDDLDFTGSYAVRKTEEPHDCDLVWELPPKGGSPIVLFPE